MDNYICDLNHQLRISKKQNTLYQPTPFWAAATESIIADIREYGLNNFRALNSALRFFVPTYGVPGNSFTAEQKKELIALLHSNSPNKKALMALESFLSGRETALADFRVMSASDNTLKKPYLHHFSESSVGAPVEHFEFEGRKFSRSALNYLLGLSYLKNFIEDEEITTVMEIGGGFGVLGEILASAGINGMRYINVDIPPTSLVAYYYLQNVLGHSKVIGYNETKEFESINIDSLPLASVLCAWQIEKLKGKIDLFVNFISFQEMEPQVVSNYLNHVKRLNSKWILLRNLREGKQMRSEESPIGVDNPIKDDDYIKMLQGYQLIGRNVIPYGYKTLDGFHSELMLFKKT